MTLLQNEVETIHRAKKATNAIRDDVAYAEVESAVEDLIKVIGRVQARLIQSNERIKRLENALNTAWEIIANTSGGEWKQQHPQWQKAAARWRDNEFLPAMLDRKAKEAKP